MKAKNDLLSGGRKVRHFSLQRIDGFASELTFFKSRQILANIQFRQWLCDSIIGRKIRKPLTTVRINNV